MCTAPGYSFLHSPCTPPWWRQTGCLIFHISGPQPRTSASTPLDARDSDRNHTIWHARIVLATTGLHLAQFRHKHRPLAKAVDYAELFIYDEAQEEAALSDIAILGALPRKCLLLRRGGPRQTSGGTGPGRLAQEVRAVSDELALGIGHRASPSCRKNCLASCRTSSLMTSRLGQSSSCLRQTPPRGQRAGCPLVVLPLALSASLSVQSGLASAMR